MASKDQGRRTMTDKTEAQKGKRSEPRATTPALSSTGHRVTISPTAKHSADSTEIRKGRDSWRRATTPTYTPIGRRETVGSSSRRRLSAVYGDRILFPETTRKSCDDVLPAENFTSTEVDQPVKLQMGERELKQKPITIMSVLRLKAEKYPERQAYAQKSDDKWHYITFKETYDLVCRAAKGFISFGLQRFSGVAIIGRNAPEWAIANFAAIHAGGIAVPLSTALSVDECCRLIKNTQCSILVIGSPKQFDIVTQIRKKSLFIKAVIKYGKDDGGKSVRFHTWEKLLAMGDKVDDERLKERIQFQAPNLCCTILHTPGTIGPPKPVMLSHDNIVWTARALGNRLSCCHASGVVVSIITLAHISGLVFDLYVPLMFASTVHFLPSPVSMRKNIFEWTREAQPTVVYTPFLVFEEMYLHMKSHLTRSFFARIIYWWARSVGHKGYEAMMRRRSMPIGWSLANALVYKKIRIAFGLQNSREIFFAGRIHSPEAFEFFACLNMPVLEILGMAESSGPITVAAVPDMFRITSVGKPIDGCSTKIVRPDVNGVGDLRIRGRNVFMGYLNHPEMTNKAFDKEGWFITGDLVSKDEDGFLYYCGRTAELLTLKSGESISPEPIEVLVRDAMPFIRTCMVVGNGRKYLSILLAIKTVVNWTTFEVTNTLTPDAKKWFQKMGYNDDNIDRFLTDPDKRILKKIQDIIDGLNAKAIPSHRIGNWTILPRDFTIASGEINWTVRLRRFYIEKKYAATIDSLYIKK